MWWWSFILVPFVAAAGAIGSGSVAAVLTGMNIRRAALPAFIILLGGFGLAESVPAPPAIRVASVALGWALVTLAIIDARVYRLPDILTLPLGAAGLLTAFLLPGSPVLAHLAAAGIGYGVFALIRWGYGKLRGVEGIGLGDAKLLAGAGAWLGAGSLPSVVLVAAGAAFVWVGVRLMGRGRAVLTERIAFGVPLCLAIWLVWLFGPLTL